MCDDNKKEKRKNMEAYYYKVLTLLNGICYINNSSII